jgi:hypothetical protein
MGFDIIQSIAPEDPGLQAVIAKRRRQCLALDNQPPFTV